MPDVMSGQQIKNKSFAPRLVFGEYLQRKRLLNSLFLQGVSGKRVLALEAQAGQGKSNFAAQYLERIGTAFCWYQVGHEDLDPVGFISQFVASLHLQCPEILLPSLQDLIDSGEVTPGEPDRFAAIFASEVAQELKHDLYLVFDDIHLLEDSRDSLRFLQLLIKSAPEHLRFILLSRKKILLDDLMPENIIRIGNEKLSLSRNEISELCTSILNIPTSGDRVQILHQSTEGWIMGVILASQSSSANNDKTMKQRLRGMGGKAEGDIFNYFQQEVLSSLLPDHRCLFLCLSLLETIPLALAQQLVDNADALVSLHHSRHQNLFVRSLDEENCTFVFHHLFRDCLRDAAAKELSLNQQQEVYLKAANWYQINEQPEKSLDYYLLAEDYSRASSLLRQLGPNLLAANRLVTLQAVLTQLPEPILEDNSWLSFFCGVTRMQSNPPGAYLYLKGACESFAEEGDSFGELLAATHLVNFHCIVDGMLNSGRFFLDRANSLYDQQANKLNDSAHFQIAQVLSVGNIYIASDTRMSGRYAEIALRLAENSGHANLLFGAAICDLYRYGFHGDWPMMRKAIENLTTAYTSLSVSSLNKATFRMLYLNLLAMEGDFESYRHVKNILLKGTFKGVSQKTLCEPFLLIFDIDAAIARGRIDEAEAAVQKALKMSGAATSLHMRSQYLHYHAYILSLRGEREGALAAARESLKLRTVVGGRYLVAINDMILGATYVQLRMFETADTLLTRAIEFFAEIGNGFNCAAAYAHRAQLRLVTDDQSGARADIRQMLLSLKEKNSVHFFTWTPWIVEGLLRVSEDCGIEVDYARKLCCERLGRVHIAQGKTVPLLKIKTLGELELTIDGGAKVSASQLTPRQRELLAMLIVAPGGGLSLGEIQLALWAESSEKKARSKLDNLLLRLRRLLDDVFGGKGSSNYLVLEKGMLCLRHCRIDTVEFQWKVEAGLVHQKRKNFRSAGNSFRSAHNLWSGEFILSVQTIDSINDFRRDLFILYLKSASQFTEVLVILGQFEDAIGVAQHALRYDRTNEVLIKWSYNLFVQNGNLVDAGKVIRRYEEALANDNYSASEIEKILERFWAGGDLN